MCWILHGGRLDVTIPVERLRPSKTGLHFEPKVATSFSIRKIDLHQPSEHTSTHNHRQHPARTTPQHLHVGSAPRHLERTSNDAKTATQQLDRDALEVGRVF
jgi:hypothetical protein